MRNQNQTGVQSREVNPIRRQCEVQRCVNPAVTEVQRKVSSSAADQNVRNRAVQYSARVVQATQGQCLQ